MSTSHPSQNKNLISRDEYAHMPESHLSELVNGVIIPVSPTSTEHGHLEARLSYFLQDFVIKNDFGWVLVGEVGVHTRYDPDTIRGADIVFVSKERLPQGPHKRFLRKAPELVVEIISPSDKKRVILEKVDGYLKIGIDQIWVAEPKSNQVHVFDQENHDGYALEENKVLYGRGILEGFELSLSKLFAKAS